MSDAPEPAASIPHGPHPGATPDCHGDVCITCSDDAVAVRIVDLLGDDLALVDTGGPREEVSVALVEAGVGDTVLVHAKEALAVIQRTPMEAGR